MDKFVSLAKEAVGTYVKTGEVIRPSTPLPKDFSRRAGVFVSIHKIAPFVNIASSFIKERFRSPLHPQELYDGYQPIVNKLPRAKSPRYSRPSGSTSLFSVENKEELRGCIGTYLPAKDNLALEIIHNAIESATRDPRFPPITSGELPHLRYSVDILSALENVIKIEDLDAKRYGLIISTVDGRKGLLLPDLEGVETVDDQIEICRQKAGILPEEKITLQRFTVERHKEK